MSRLPNSLLLFALFSAFSLTACAGGGGASVHQTRGTPPQPGSSQPERVVSHADDPDPRHPRLYDINGPHLRNAPNPAPTVAPPPATPTNPLPHSASTTTQSIHVVQPGDTLWRISKQYGVSVDNLRAANQIEGDTIQPGQVLRLR